MRRVLILAFVILLLSACGGGVATPDPAEVQRLVDEAVQATVVALPAPEEQIVEVERIVKETVVVEKPVEVTVVVEKVVKETVIVEREIAVTPTPKPSDAGLSRSEYLPRVLRWNAILKDRLMPQMNEMSERGGAGDLIGICTIDLYDATTIQQELADVVPSSDTALFHMYFSLMFAEWQAARSDILQFCTDYDVAHIESAIEHIDRFSEYTASGAKELDKWGVVP